MARSVVGTPPIAEAPQPSLRSLRESVKRRELILAAAELTLQEKLVQQAEANFLSTAPEPGWDIIASGSNLGYGYDKGSAEAQPADLRSLRQASYRAWRRDPHGRGILRTFVKFIIGREFGLDFADTQRGRWSADKSRVEISEDEDDRPAVQLWWEDFEARNQWRQRAKEIVLRALRDGECFVRKFSAADGRITLRFIEPGSVQGSGRSIYTPPVDPGAGRDLLPEPRPTVITDGIEHLADDVETVVAYHVATRSAAKPEPIPAAEILHVKANCDLNDLRGIPLLEVALTGLTNYSMWEQSRVLLNRIRTAVAMVRKVTGTPQQAANIVAGRAPSTPSPGPTPSTTSGRSEAAFRPGSILTPGPGVDYEFKSPNLDARDAGEDGRRFLMTIAAGYSLPEMLITGDWSNSSYSSSVEARTPAVREWEDWQDFFAPPFTTIISVWVLGTAITAGALPPNTDPRMTIQWPPLVATDALKETQRREILNQSRILSRTTWSAQEALDPDDERENFREEDEQDGPTPLDAIMPALGDGTGSLAKQNGAVGLSREQRAKALHQALIALGDVEGATESAPSALREAVQGYVAAARGVLFQGQDSAADGRSVQSVLLSMEQHTSKTSATRWLRTHGFKSRSVIARDGWWVAEQWDPAERVGKGQLVTLTEGVQAVVAPRTVSTLDALTALGDGLKAIAESVRDVKTPKKIVRTIHRDAKGLIEKIEDAEHRPA